MTTSADVPNKYDLVIDDGTTATGFVLYDAYTGGDSSNAPQKAIHSFTPTFIPRTNVQGNFGENQQDFWMSFHQRDWSLGEQQKFAQNEDQGVRRYWIGENVDITEPGEVSLRRKIQSLTFGESVHASTPQQKFADSNIWTIGASGAYSVDETGTITNAGAHGAATAESVVYGANVYVNALRKISMSPSTWTNFSSTPVICQTVHNNALYGFNRSNANLTRLNTSGTATDLFDWVVIEASGGGGPGGTDLKDPVLVSYGSKLAAGFGFAGGYSIWIYDGTGVTKVADLPKGFFIRQLHVDNGILYIGGTWTRYSSSTEQHRPAIFYYANGVLGLLWESDTYVSSKIPVPAMCSYESGVIFTDGVRGALMYYNPITGGVHTIATYTSGSARPWLASTSTFLLLTQNSTSGYLFPDDTDYATSGFVTSSLIDFDNSLTKLFRGVRIEFDSASDGNGGTVDIAYRIGDVDGAYTTLQSGATSGTEYTLGTAGSPVSGKSISVKITLNKGTSTQGPVLKRLSVRAVPQLNSFQRSQHTLNLTGRDGDQPVILRDGSPEPQDGLGLGVLLKGYAESNTLLSITDKFGTNTAVIEDCELLEIRPEEFVGRVVVREV